MREAHKGSCAVLVLSGLLLPMEIDCLCEGQRHAHVCHCLCNHFRVNMVKSQLVVMEARKPCLARLSARIAACCSLPSYPVAWIGVPEGLVASMCQLLCGGCPCRSPPSVVKRIDVDWPEVMDCNGPFGCNFGVFREMLESCGRAECFFQMDVVLLNHKMMSAGKADFLVRPMLRSGCSFEPCSDLCEIFQRWPFSEFFPLWEVG